MAINIRRGKNSEEAIASYYSEPEIKTGATFRVQAIIAKPSAYGIFMMLKWRCFFIYKFTISKFQPLLKLILNMHLYPRCFYVFYLLSVQFSPSICGLGLSDVEKTQKEEFPCGHASPSFLISCHNSYRHVFTMKAQCNTCFYVSCSYVVT